ncbi:molecular chaperone [Vibrio sp. HA2012]|uniref:OmpH family outer membrane protein n=1 Tax=Vibrio sp. HA2012 TaxID=1971595 RepID=UPI000C2BDBA7|nr:OmpH family outer membrane protein [Vibrio sp. HA2012]PJC86540.1 molecular chaperone [Vibrio sp. HA2012]
MKKIVKAAGISLVILSSSFFAHSAEAAQKIGYVSTGFLINKVPESKRELILKPLQQQADDEAAEIQKLEAKINTKIEQATRDKELLGEAGVEKLQIEIAGLKEEGKMKMDKFKDANKERQRKAQIEMVKLIQGAVTKVAEAEGYDMVIESQLVTYAKPELNLTEKVLAELN